ncbi:phage terminase large subunit [Arthrobacter sp. B3I4]|uniref:phage terminase large subunit n=1 Tax=Arthrobacter sp. B3I4 TaxID=3042267 RepID=UPI0027874626|nr:phage terminase large subunit [Arthrobacter sp. B3I4]MDQ0756086.1 putative phage terminase large subunit-like protein [Arthrobacter sp. B3I4]
MTVDMWEAAARMFEPMRHDWATPGDLAKAIEPSTVQTPALDLIDEYLVKVESGEIDRLIINLPPQEGKSTRVTTIGPLWFLTRNKNRRIAIVSYAQDLADEFGRNIRNHISSNTGDDETLDLGLRVAKDNGAARRWQLEGARGGVRAVGIRGGLTGRPVDALFIDDPISNLEQANSKTYRDQAWGFWQSVGNTRLAPGAPVILVLTRWHADDLAGRLLAAEDAHRWTVLNIPAAAEENDPLGRKPGEWLESSRKRTAKQWEQIKVAVGPKVWQSLYQGNPSLDEGGVLPTTWTHYDQPLWLVDHAGAHTVPGIGRDDHELVQSWDLTFKGGDTSDYVVGQVWLRVGNTAYLLDQVRRRMNFNETCEAIKAMSAKWPQAVAKFVEDKANGPAVMNALSSTVAGLIPIEPEGSKYARVSAVSPLAWSGNVQLPSTRLAPWVETFLQEALSFPSGANDDQLDAFSQAINRLLLMPILNQGNIIEPDVYDVYNEQGWSISPV